MLVEADIPMVFVSRKDGFRILGESLKDYSCGADGTGTAVSTPVGGSGSPVDIRAVFDGWGYVHQYDASSMKESPNQPALRGRSDPRPACGRKSDGRASSSRAQRPGRGARVAAG